LGAQFVVAVWPLTNFGAASFSLCRKADKTTPARRPLLSLARFFPEFELHLLGFARPPSEAKHFRRGGSTGEAATKPPNGRLVARWWPFSETATRHCH